MKYLYLAPLAAVALVLLVVLAPLVLVYLLFDRFCSLVEEFAPTRNRKHEANEGGRFGLLKKLFSAIAPNVENSDKKGGLLPHQRPF